ncbi:MAG TPA: adenosylmethionine decarboxylase [Burkholderiaceae bacterium]|nr:adenosylmethionine decarboxylase [Burkholderiaceae bacterium]
MQGLHLTADLSGCAPAAAAMTQAEALRHLCLQAAQGAGLTPVAELFHRFAPLAPGQPPGLTGVVLLAESHLAVHTWPERGAVTLDVYVCNAGADHSGRAEQALAALIAGFAPGHVQRQQLQRGALPARAPQAHPRHLDTHLETHTGPGSMSMHRAREQSP